MQSRASRSDAVRKALLQAKLETGGTVKAPPSQTDYKEKIDRLKSKTEELKSQQVNDVVESNADKEQLSPPMSVVDHTSEHQQSEDTVSEEDGYIHVNVSQDDEKKTEPEMLSSDIDDVSHAEEVEVSDFSKLAVRTDTLESSSFDELNETSKEVVGSVEEKKDGEKDEAKEVKENKEVKEEIVQPLWPPLFPNKIGVSSPDKIGVSSPDKIGGPSPDKIGLLSPVNASELVPDGADFHKGHAVFTVSTHVDMLEVYNVWVPFNCSWDDLTEAIVNKVKLNSSKSIKKMVLMENTGDVLSPDIKTASKFFKIFQNFEAGNSTFVLSINLEMEASLQAAKDLDSFRAAALRLTFVCDKTKEEQFVYLTRNFDWDDILNAIVLEYPSVSLSWISHIIMLDSDGDEISPPISSVDKFWKFTRTASMHNGDVFVFYQDENQIAADAEKAAKQAYLDSCRPITLQVKGSNAEFTALVPLNCDWDTIRKQISVANPEDICDPEWIVQLLLVDSENDKLSPNIDGDSMFWKVFPTFSTEYNMKYLISLDAAMMEDFARVKQLEEYRAASKHLCIALANDQDAKVGDIYVPHQCEWELLTEGVADYLNISTPSWIDYFVLLDHEHDPISPPLKNITMFWKACEKFDVDKGMVLNVYLKPEAISTLKELAFLSKANSFCVRLAVSAGAGEEDDSSVHREENRVYVNPDSNWNEMITAIALTLQLDSYEWIENVVLIDDEGDILSPAIKTTEKFWRFYKKSMDGSIFLVNQDEALKAGAIANKRKMDEDAAAAKKEKEMLHRAGMKVFHCLVYDHEVNDGTVAPVECDIRLHSSCPWEDILHAVDDSNVTESVFVKYLLLVDSAGQRLSVPIKNSKMFWKFAPSAEKGSANNNHFEVHLDYDLRTEILRTREQDKIRNMQKKIEVAAGIGDKSSVVSLFSDSTWDDIRDLLIRTSGFPGQLEGSCIEYLVLYDIDGDQLSPRLNTAEAFWSTFHTIYNFERNMQFVITLSQDECDMVLARKAHEEFVNTAFKFKLCKKNDSTTTTGMRDVLVSPKALWQDVVIAIADVFCLDSPSWVHHIVLLDGDGDALSRSITETTLFWKTAATYQYNESKYFQLHIDSSAVEDTKRSQAHEAFKNAAEHISIRNATSGATGTLLALFDSPWRTICKAIISELKLSPNVSVVQCTLIDEDMDELSPSVCSAEKFWKIYKNNYKQNMNMSFSVEVSEGGSVIDYDASVDTGDSNVAVTNSYTVGEKYESDSAVERAQLKLSRKEKAARDEERYRDETELTQQLAPTEAVHDQHSQDQLSQDQHQVQDQDQDQSQQEPYYYPYVEVGYVNLGATIVRSKKETEELEAAYLQACASKNLDNVVDLVEHEGVNPLVINHNKSTAAHFACAGGACPPALIAKLYQYGLDLNSTNVSGATPMSCAVIAGDVEACQCLLHYCPEIDLNFSHATHPILHHAVDQGHVHVLMWLHDMGANVDLVNSAGMTAVILAVETTPFDMGVLQYLIEMGADMFLCAPGDFSAMHAAANTDNLQAVEFLYEMGMPIDGKTEDGKTPLMFACSQGHLEVSKWLHSQGASLYSCGGKVDKLNTSLHLAAQFGHLDIIQWLVEECRLNPTPRNSKNATPADFARAANKMDVFLWLNAWIEAHPESDMSSEFKEYEHLEETLFRNDFDAAMTLLEEMSDRFTKDTVLPHGTTPLHYVAASGYMELAKYLVQAGCDVNMRTNAGRTPLHYASFKGHTDMCMFLYESGASVDETDNGGLTCLKIAEQNNYQSLVLWLRSTSLQNKGTKMPKLTSPSSTSAKTSTFGGFFSCVSATPEVNHSLGEASSDIGDQDKYGGYNFSDEGAPGGMRDATSISNQLAVQLHEACILGDLALARDLVEKDKAPVNGSPSFPNPLLPVDEQELTPLHGAVSSGNLPLVQFLVNKGAMVNAQNVGGLFNQSANENSEAMTPLHIACDKHHDSIVMYLVSQGADLYKKNMAGDTSLHIICLLGLHSLLRQIVDLPRSTLPDLNLDVRSSHLLNLLHCAADAGSIETAEILVENNVGVNSFDDEKKTPMHYACAKGSLQIVKLLVNNGAIVDLTDTTGRTPFLFACSSDNLELMKYLSERGAQIDHESNKGNNALHIACKFGRLDLVMWLVQNGLKADRINSSGHSPMHYAQANNFDDVVEWLESH